MIKKPIVIQVSDFRDARPIAHLVQEASQYKSRIYIEVENKQVNAKSMMGMMGLKLLPGNEIVVVTEGNDEEEAASGIERFFVEMHL